ncbi:MAG: hypothetical protein HRT91_04515 [Piscirickettsiaceae bacterium]|nr:hypothetical protein [Piscirickettsiaceae bacterium]
MKIVKLVVISILVTVMATCTLAHESGDALVKGDLLVNWASHIIVKQCNK